MEKIPIWKRMALFFFIVFIFGTLEISAQNIVVTDKSTYTADPSAMLDVESDTKGMLIPRMTTTQRNVISNPAEGLLVYDITESSFYFRQGTGWVRLSSVNENPGSDDALFFVSNSSGDTIFAVYNDGVKITVTETSKGNVGGFAVSGRSTGKEKGEYDILRITHDSTRIYVKDTAYTKGKVGGFAVSGRSTGKSNKKSILLANVDSTRIYIDPNASKGSVGGFAVSGRSSTKGTSDKIMDLTPDNYFIGHEAGLNVKPALAGYEGKYNTFFGYRCGYSDSSGYMNLFSGYEAGFSNLTGLQNVYLGYLAGYGIHDGSLNVMIGSQAGRYADTSTHDNVFIGFAAARDKRSGSGNVMIGKYAGGATELGTYNVIIGNYAGNNINGEQTGGRNLTENVILGRRAAYNGIGSKNVVLGAYAGHNLSVETSEKNVFLGYFAGYNETGSNKLYIDNTSTSSPLIYGEFDNNILTFNADVNTVNLNSGAELNRTETSTANLVPIAYGCINADGTIASGSGNFSASWDSVNSRYLISFTGESYYYNTYTTVVTLISNPRMVATSSVSGSLMVKFYTDSSTLDTSGNRFSFVVYKE